MKMIIRLDTGIGLVTFEHEGKVRDAFTAAIDYLTETKIDLGGGSEALVSVGVIGGMWHRIGRVPYSCPPNDEWISEVEEEEEEEDYYDDY